MEGHLGQTKGSLFNLIIYTDEKRRMEYYNNIVDSVIEKFPTRIIMIKSDSESRDKIEINETNDSPSKQFLIKGSQELLEKDPFVVLPYLVPDLPVYLIWDKDPTTQNDILTFLETISRRMIYGSECTDNLQKFAQEILKKNESFKGDLMDLDWALLGGWRDIITKSFNSPERIDQLKNSSKISLYYNHIPSEHICRTDTQGIYLQGWLAAVFNWTFKEAKEENDKKSIIYTNNGNEITIQLLPKVDEAFAPGTILSLVFINPNHSECDITISPKQNNVTVKNTTKDKCELPFSLPLPNIQRGLAFIKELFFHQISDHYYLMLEKIAQMKWGHSWW